MIANGIITRYNQHERYSDFISYRDELGADTVSCQLFIVQEGRAGRETESRFQGVSVSLEGEYGRLPCRCRSFIGRRSLPGATATGMALYDCPCGQRPALSMSGANGIMNVTLPAIGLSGLPHNVRRSIAAPIPKECCTFSQRLSE